MINDKVELMTKSTKVLFNNHSSLLIKRNGKFLLTDPWFQTPAFGSWLPTFPPYLHPIYVSSLKDKLTVLVSHGHDDHFDDKLLTLFDKDTRFVTAKFKSPSVKNRLKRIGFENLIEVDNNGTEVDSEFFIKSFIDEKIFKVLTLLLHRITLTFQYMDMQINPK